MTSSRRSFAIALLAGAISATGFAPLGLWPLTLIALAAIMALAIDVSRLRTAFGIGWWFGVGHFTVMLNWIAHSFTYQDAMPVWLGWGAVVLVSLYFAIYPALALGLAWRFGKGMPLVFAVLFAGAWIVSEYLRATLFSGFAWNPLAAITVGRFDGLQMTLPMITRWIGTYGLSGLLALGSGALFLLYRNKALASLMLFTPIIAGAMASYMLYSLEDFTEGFAERYGNRDPQPAIRVVQPNIDQSVKWDADHAAENFAQLADATGETGDRPRLIFWPEAAVPDYIEDDPMARLRIADLLGPEDMLMIGATKIIWEEQEDGRSRAVGGRNAFYALTPRGEVVARYDKAHLLPFAEYLPARPVLEAIGISRFAPGDLDFWPGPGPQTVNIPGFGTVGGQICYEIVFSGRVIDDANRPDFIFSPSNDAWFGRWGPPQHVAQARLRAAEEAMPVIRSTPTGVSSVIDRTGMVTHSLPWRTAGAIDAILPRPGEPTLFSRFGNWLPLGLALLFFISAFALRRRAG